MLVQSHLCTSVLYSKLFKLSTYSWWVSKKYYMNLFQVLSIFLYLVLKILVFCLSPRDSHDWGLPITKMFQHVLLFAFINMQISAVLEKKIFPFRPLFNYTHFKLLNNLFTRYRKIITCHTINVSGCHELACIRVSYTSAVQSLGKPCRMIAILV